MSQKRRNRDVEEENRPPVPLPTAELRAADYSGGAGVAGAPEERERGAQENAGRGRRAGLLPG